MKAITLVLTLVVVLTLVFLWELKEENSDLSENLKHKNSEIAWLRGDNELFNESLMLSLVKLSSISNLLFEKESELVNAKEESKIIIYPKNLTLGKYTVKIVENCHMIPNEDGSVTPTSLRTNNSIECWGYTYNKNDMTVVDNRSLTDIISTCSHEAIHSILYKNGIKDPRLNENMTTELEAQVTVKECKLLEG